MASSTSTRTAVRRPELLRVAAVGAGALLFGVLLVLVRLQWVPLEDVDHGLAAALNRMVAPHHPLVLVLGFISRIGSTAVLVWLVAIAVTLLIVRRRYRLAVYLVVTGAGALALDPSLKAAVGRLRPVVAHPVAHGGGDSFPSGHALGSSVVYGALLLVFLPALPARARRPVTVAVAVLLGLIGFSRLALGVHFLSDVLGAWALGVAWLGITAYALELWRVEAGRRPTRPLAEGLEPEAADDLAPTQPTVHTAVVQTPWVLTASVMVWVLVFGLLYVIGRPLAKYHGGNGNILGDHTIPHWLAAHRSPALTTVSFLGSEAGNTHAILAVGLIVGALALAFVRQWRPVVFLLATMLGELTLFLASAAAVGRARPDVPHLDGRLPTSSFPSGHVAATICLYWAIVVLVWPRTRAWWRWVPVALAVLMPLWVAASRMYRGMHHPTDVLASALFAACWLTAMAYLIKPNCDVVEGEHRAAPARPATRTGRALDAAAR